MSNPVTNVEIEDVLSSIRRLVAEGDGAEQSKIADETVPSAPAERFVLTPSLRVAETMPDPVTSQDAPDEVMSDESQQLAAQFVAPAPAPLVLEPAQAVTEPLVHDAMSDAERASLEATIAELEAAVTDQTDLEWEPDGSETTAAPAQSLADMFAADGDLVEHDDIEEVSEDDDGQDDHQDGDQQGAQPTQTATADVVPLHSEDEPTFRHTPDVDAPDTDYGDDLAADADDEGMPIPDDLDESIAAYLAGAARVDKEMLRSMITDVVRQELQGEMGERITRNIRKLVRREIANALSSKNFS